MNVSYISQFAVVLFLLVTVLLPAVVCQGAVDYYSPENVRKFADFLYEQGDYLRAAGEYQRYLFYQPQESAHIHYRIAVCYRFGGKTAQAIQGFETVLRRYPTSRWAVRSYYQIGATYFLADRFEESAGFLREVLPRLTDVQQSAEVEELLGVAYLQQKRWAEAGRIFKTLQGSEVESVRERASVYHSYVESGSRLPTRSPAFAGILSTVLPGAGRFYTGRAGDALTSLLLVGLTGWQAYAGFHKDGLSSVKGWTFGTACGLFYVGNIYGSVISARVYNRHLTDEFLATLSIEILLY